MTIIMTRERILDPTSVERNVHDLRLAPRPKSLRGLRVGLLDNTKANSIPLLEQLAEALRKRYGVGEARLYTKDYFGTPVKPELFAQVVEESDIVLTGVGDCGSCSAATVADGIMFERAGVPAVSYCTEPFQMSGAAMAELQGFPGYEFAFVRHPISNRTVEEIGEFVAEVLPETARILGAEA